MKKMNAFNWKPALWAGVFFLAALTASAQPPDGGFGPPPGGMRGEGRGAGPMVQAHAIQIATAKTALNLSVGQDGRLNQASYGAAATGTPGGGMRGGPRGGGRQGGNAEAYLAAGDGYVFEPALRVDHADGNTSLDLRWVSEKVEKSGDDLTVTRIEMKDPAYPFFVTLIFKAYQKEDVIAQSVEIRHEEPGPVVLHQFASTSLMLPARGDIYLTHFYGQWADEMNLVEEKLTMGIKTIDSKLGVRAQYYTNPSFVLALGAPARENEGTVIGGTLAWSGSFALKFEMNPTMQLRAICGMNDYNSEYHLKKGEVFATPAMLWSWSAAGKGELSRNFQSWGRKYGVRDGDKERAVLLNNWEATGFDFDENKLVALFDGTKEAGLELFLLDDGWFANKYPRNDDRAGLGDWDTNTKKLPHGVGYLTDEAKKRGLRFGIWLEPEMVNPRSELFEKHPDWVIQQPKRAFILPSNRNQLILDLTRPEVKEYVFKVIDDTLTKNPGVSYVKWDCNRFVDQPGSTYLKADEQSHLWINYVRALYEIMDRVAKKHPQVELMVCSGGGGRVDYGALPYFHEFWPSDKTDPVRRIFIQYGYSHFFPAVATANHVTRMGNRPLKFTFDVAMSGRMGMDVDLGSFSAAEKKFTAAAVATYKRIRNVVLQGDLYRLESPYDGNRASLDYVNAEKTHAILFVYQQKNATTETLTVKPQGLDPAKKYKVAEINLPEGATSKLKEAGKVIDGAALMKDGITSPCAKAYESAVIELAAE